MTKRTRVFVLGASAFLLVGLASAGVASYVGIAGLQGIGAPAELSYVPRSAQLLASIDVRHMVDSELGQKLLASGKGPIPANLLAEAGVNVYTDVDSIVVAAPGVGPNTEEPPLALVRGTFDEAKIESTVVGKGGTSDQHLGVRTLNLGSVSLAFVSQGLIAIGSSNNVRLALETGVNGGPSIKDNDEAMRLVNRVDGGDTWIVANFEALQGAPFPAQVAQQLPAITWFAASGQVDSGISALVHAETRDDQAAKDLQDVVRGLVALARMQVDQQQNLGLTDVINSIQLSGEGNTVSFGFSVPAQTLDTIIKSTTAPEQKVSHPLPTRPIQPTTTVATSAAL
jgi:hypothetical protein